MRGRIAVPAAALALCLSGLTGSAAAAAKPPRFHHLITGAAPAFADGSRFVVVPLRGSMLAVYDTRTGRRRFEHGPAIPSPDGGASPCPVRDIGGGVVLWSCRRIQDLATGRYQDAPPIDDPAAPYSDAFLTHIGGYWTEGLSALPNYSGHAESVPIFINWRTGQVRFSVFMNHYGDHHVEDLNSPTLMRPLCLPLQRPRYQADEPYFRTGYDQISYEPPFALRLSSRGEPLLGRCGRRAFTRLARCSDERVMCLYVQLGAGIVTWSDAVGVYAYRAASRRRMAWDLLAASRSPDPGVILPVGHTAHAVVVSVPRDPYALATTNWDTRIARWP
jgi:hypothetical protein